MRKMAIIALVALLSGCTQDPVASTYTISQDDVRSISLTTKAQLTASRVVVLANGVAEIIQSMNAQSIIVGRDISSTEDSLADIPIVTSGHQVLPEKVIALKPDLVLIDASTGPKAAIETIKSAGITVIETPESWSLKDLPIKVRVYTYLQRLGKEGVRRMAAMSVLSSRYLFARLGKSFPSLPAAADGVPRMHEFILTLTEEDFKRIEAAGIPRASIIARVGKLFLDFGFHAPTVAFPEVFGLMIEPTESYTKTELDRFAEVVLAIGELIRTNPEVLKSTPRFTPVDRVDEVAANRSLVLSEHLTTLPKVNENRLSPVLLNAMPVAEIKARILATV